MNEAPNMPLKTLLRKLTHSDRHKRHTFCFGKSCASSVVGLTGCYAATSEQFEVQVFNQEAG